MACGAETKEAAMKRILAVFALILVATSSHAQPRPSTVNRPCAASQRLVLQHGAIVLGTGGPTYDRFVRDVNFCMLGEYISPVWVPALDTPQCFIGYRCKQGPRDLFDWDE
jgi:hypothetical protein